MVSLIFTLTALLSVAAAISLPPNLHTRQTNILKTGSWLITYKPNAPNSQTYRGPLRVTSTSEATFISGDLYNGTIQPNPADGSPILPRNNYWAFLRATKLTPGSNGGFSMNLEYWNFGGFQVRPRYWDTIWARQPADGGYIVELAPATAPNGYPDGQNYFEGNVKIASSGVVVGTFTMGWVSTYLRRINLEIGTVSGLKVPQSDTTGTRTWKSIFSEAGYDISVTVGKTDIPEPSNTVGPGWWNVEQQHDAVLKYRGPTDYDKEWKYYLLVVRRMVETARGAMIDPGREFDGIPREGTTIASEWRVGTNPDGTEPDTVDDVPWPASVVGKKFVELQDPWFRTAVHEVGHCFNLAHPTEFGVHIMTDTPSFVTAGADGVTPQQFPDNINVESMKFQPSDIFLMQHRPDTHIRPGFVEFGAAAQDKVPPPAVDLDGNAQKMKTRSVAKRQNIQSEAC